MKQEKFYITTPIFYPNGVPHIGHAYTSMVCDVIARFERLNGKDVLFLTGTDEHGLKMQQTAIEQGISTKELADINSAQFQDMMVMLNISNDDFIRTTQERHHKSCQALWSAMEANGDIYLDKYSGWYSVRQEAYFDEEETTLGEDGVRREPLGSPVEWVEEESYFFKLSLYQDKLLAHIENNPDFIMPKERKNEIVSFLKSGLRDLSVSRTTFDWGVKVPNNDKHVMYVWVDALTNYITGAGYPNKEDSKWRYWPADIHMMGKDITRFHAVYWPAFLLSAGIELPKRIFAHGFLNNKGEKMSKSVGNVISPTSMVEKYGLDAIRYFFMAEVSLGQDGSYSHEVIVNRINANLANDLGNLAQRSLSMIAKHCNKQVPQYSEFNNEDNELLDKANALLKESSEFIEKQEIHKMLSNIWKVVADTNRYFASQEPWSLKKTNPERMKSVLYITAEVLRHVAILTQPVMPQSSAKLLDLLGVNEGERDFTFLSADHALKVGTNLPAPQGIFPRYIESDKE